MQLMMKESSDIISLNLSSSTLYMQVPWNLGLCTLHCQQLGKHVEILVLKVFKRSPEQFNKKNRKDYC